MDVQCPTCIGQSVSASLVLVLVDSRRATDITSYSGTAASDVANLVGPIEAQSGFVEDLRSALVEGRMLS